MEKSLNTFFSRFLWDKLIATLNKKYPYRTFFIESGSQIFASLLGAKTWPDKTREIERMGCANW